MQGSMGSTSIGGVGTGLQQSQMVLDLLVQSCDLEAN